MISQPFHYSIPETGSMFDLPTSLTHISQPHQQQSTTVDPTSLDFDLHLGPWTQKETSYPISKVILFKGVPEDLAEEEVLELCQPFGVIKDIFIKKQKRYVFLQFDRVEQAQRCFESFKKFPTVIRGFPLYVFCTGKNEITKPIVPIQPPSRFLMLMFNVALNIDSNTISKLLTPYGRCIKVVFLQSKNTQVFVEMEDVSQAITVKDDLDGQSVSGNVHLNVYFSDEKEAMPKISYASHQGLSTMGTLDHIPSTTNSQSNANASFKNIWSSENQEGSYLWNSTGQSLMTQGSFVGGGYPKEPSSATIKPKQKQKPKFHRFDSQEQEALYMEQKAQYQEPMSKAAHSMNSISHVKEEKSPTILLIKNLPNGITAKMLFRLFGMYGNVLKVKIFFKNPENALVEYQTAEQAELAKLYLNNCLLYGNNIFVTNSKLGVLVDLSALRKCQETQFMGNYLNSPEHRYKFNGSKNHLNIVPPSKVIHLSNLCEDKDEDFYHVLFKEYGIVTKFMFMKGPEKMALMEMDSIESSVKILMSFHNFNIDGKYLKVSFSKYQRIKDV